MKKILGLILIVILTLTTLSGCTQNKGTTTPAPQSQSKAQVQPVSSAPAAPSADKKIDYPTKPIKFLVSGSAGGATDIGIRILAPFLEKELGQPITIENNGGAGGWIVWTQLTGSKPDGYTLSNVSIPHIPAGLLDTKADRKINLDSFTMLANQVSDFGIIAVRKDETRIKDIKGLIEYAQKNELTAISTGVAGDDHIAILKTNKAFNTKLVPVHFKSSPEAFAAFLGGHVDILYANVSEVTNMHKNKELKVIAVMSKDRSIYLPDVPTVDESGFKGLYSGSSRGIAAPAGLDPQIAEKIVAAIEKTSKNEEYLKKLKEIGLECDFVSGIKYKQMYVDEGEKLKDMKAALGY